MIDVDHLSKRYGETLAVNDLSFRVRPGLVTGFLGPNGAGKSTTMRLIVGLDKPTAGSVTVDAGRTATSRRRCGRSARCSKRERSTRAGRPTTTCSRWRRPTASRRHGSTR